MANPRESLIADLNRSIGHKKLIWFGIRGEDAAPLLALDAFGASFALTAVMGGASLDPEHDVALEGLCGFRMDLDRYDLDSDLSPSADDFRDQLIAATSTECVLVTYRPSAFTSSLAFSMEDTMSLAGMHLDRQRGFEHKPWVETQLSQREVRTLGWRYIADSRRSIVLRTLEDGPLVIRTSRGSGGVGVSLVRTAEDLELLWPDESDHFAAVAPYVDDAIPVNLSGCVFADGSISCHPPSVQLIGDEALTSRPFGYCGNCFSSIKGLTPAALDALQELLLTVGAWLHEERYLGAFGVDALVRGDDVLFTEVNARMQGSTALSAQIAQRLDLPDLVLDHLASNLGLPKAHRSPTVRDWASMQPDVAHVIVHNSDPETMVNVGGEPQVLDGERWTLEPGLLGIESGGVLGRLVWPGRVTDDGFSVSDPVRAAIEHRRTHFVARERVGR